MIKLILDIEEVEKINELDLMKPVVFEKIARPPEKKVSLYLKMPLMNSQKRNWKKEPQERR